MTDILTVDQRSARMALIRGKNTSPELMVRRLVHRLGYRYRLHCSDILGKPDLVFRPKQKLIFVHGCFWHQHEAKNCKMGRMPKSKLHYWQPNGNKQRDKKIMWALRRLGWSVLQVWECELSNQAKLISRLSRFLAE